MGSLRTVLFMKHRDIAFHIYSERFDISESFSAISGLSKNRAIKRIEYANLSDTEEKCFELHAWYMDSDGLLWQLDMIHILKGSRYDGYFESVADRICVVLTPEQTDDT